MYNLTQECVNDPEGGAPYWDPPFDHDVNPFPSCVKSGKNTSITLYRFSDFITYKTASDGHANDFNKRANANHYFISW